MTRSLLVCLPLLFCLPSLSATGQVPAAVKLLPGDCIDRPMFGLDSATYYAAVTYIAAAPGLLAEGRAAALSLQQQLAIEQAGTKQLRGDVLRARQDDDATHVRFDQLSAQNKALQALPIQKPLLLDTRTYTVGGLATLAGFILGLVLHK